MSIKSKIQSLISAANSATGESDTTLTDAVQTLVDGYGQGGGGGELEHHQFTHAEDWLTDATGNGRAFYNTYLSQLYTNKNSGFGFAVITNNNATQYAALYTFRNFALINKSSWVRSSGTALSNDDTGATNLSFYISAGSIIDVYITEVAAT